MKNNNRLLYLLIIILTIWCVVLTSIAVNNDNTLTKQVVNDIQINGISSDLTSIVNDKKDSLVSINASGSIGSGFIYKQDGEDIYVISAYHTIADAVSYYIYFANGYSTNAELVGSNIYADIAILKIKSPYSVETLDLADATTTKSGEFILCIGTPVSVDYDQSVELGLVSNIRTIENSITVEENTVNYYVDLIQLSSNLKPGYSGSPVLNMNGEVVGMVTMNIQDGFNFAITSNEIKIIADKLISEQQVTKYQLGIKGSYIENMPMFERSNLNLSVETIYGLYVEKLLDGSVALPAGIKVGDVILNINDIELHNMNDYLSVVYSETGSLKFEVLRDGSISNYTVNLND